MIHPLFPTIQIIQELSKDKMKQSRLMNHPVYTNYACTLYIIYNIGVGILCCLHWGGKFFFLCIQFIEDLVLIFSKNH